MSAPSAQDTEFHALPAAGQHSHGYLADIGLVGLGLRVKLRLDTAIAERSQQLFFAVKTRQSDMSEWHEPESQTSAPKLHT